MENKKNDKKHYAQQSYSLEYVSIVEAAFLATPHPILMAHIKEERIKKVLNELINTSYLAGHERTGLGTERVKMVDICYDFIIYTLKDE